jgi:1,4-alpha-glucan branching enzyme
VRSRIAMGLVLTSPGIPLIFMGQEILEDKQWGDTPSPDTSIWWAGLDRGDKSMSDFLRFTRELIGVRRSHPALRGEGCAVIHVHDENRVLGTQWRWLRETPSPPATGWRGRSTPSVLPGRELVHLGQIYHTSHIIGVPTLIE